MRTSCPATPIAGCPGTTRKRSLPPPRRPPFADSPPRSPSHRHVREVFHACRKDTTKQGIKITAGHVANIKTKLNKERTAKKAVKKQAVAPVPASPVAAEPEKNGKTAATVTLEHVKAVALTVKTLGGSVRLYELLGLIKDVGGLKKFKDLLEAISGTETDAIPF